MLIHDIHLDILLTSFEKLVFACHAMSLPLGGDMALLVSWWRNSWWLGGSPKSWGTCQVETECQMWLPQSETGQTLAW